MSFLFHTFLIWLLACFYSVYNIILIFICTVIIGQKKKYYPCVNGKNKSGCHEKSFIMVVAKKFRPFDKRSFTLQATSEEK